MFRSNGFKGYRSSAITEFARRTILSVPMLIGAILGVFFAQENPAFSCGGPVRQKLDAKECKTLSGLYQTLNATHEAQDKADLEKYKKDLESYEKRANPGRALLKSRAHEFADTFTNIAINLLSELTEEDKAIIAARNKNIEGSSFAYYSHMAPRLESLNAWLNKKFVVNPPKAKDKYEIVLSILGEAPVTFRMCINKISRSKDGQHTYASESNCGNFTQHMLSISRDKLISDYTLLNEGRFGPTIGMPGLVERAPVEPIKRPHLTLPTECAELMAKEKIDDSKAVGPKFIQLDKSAPSVQVTQGAQESKATQ